MDRYPSKTAFLKYEKVRRGGKTNMLDIRKVMKMTDLDQETVKNIIENYSALAEIYLEDNDIYD